jgi:CBS-domain-containing membrane protein
MHRGPDGAVIVTADMNISVVLLFCLSLSPLIAMFSMMGPGNTSTLKGKPRFLASSTALRGIAE